MRWTALFGALAVALGCGSRSPLLSGEASGGGSGGSAGTGASGGTSGRSGAGGVGGAAGATNQCNGIAVNGPFATVDPLGPGGDSLPQLVRSNAKGDQITTVFVHQPTEFVLPALNHASFAPWAAWSSDVWPTFNSVAHPALSPIFAAASGKNDDFALVVSQGDPFALLLPSVDAWSSGVPPDTPVNGDRAAFVAAGSAGHLVGTQTNAGLLLATVIAPNGSQQFSITIACGSESPLGDAEALGDGFVAAVSTGKQDDLCAIPGGIPNRIEAHRLACTAGSCTREQLASIETGSYVEALATAPHSDGVWIVWKEAFSSRIDWALLRQSTGNLLRGQIGAGGEQPLALAADALGDSLVVAWANGSGINPPSLVISVVSDAGATTGTTAIGPSFYGPISVVGSPNGDSVVAAFSGGTPSRVQLARFDCL